MAPLEERRSKKERPAPPQPRPKRQLEQFVAFWTIEPGWHTEVQLRNNLVQHELTVTPVLRLVSGQEQPLQEVTIAPMDVVTVDLASAAAGQIPSGAEAYGSLVLR
jgi:hypothetical protein